jgi:hypothetical protein
MKKPKSKRTRARQPANDEALPEYDFSRSRRNKYASRYAKGCLVVTLDPDVAAVFPARARQTRHSERWLESFERMDGTAHRDAAHDFTLERTRCARRSP